MKKLTALALCLCLLLCAAGAAEGFELNLCIAPEPRTIDPGLADSTDAAIYTYHQFEGLLKYALTDEHPSQDEAMSYVALVPGQAAGWEESAYGTMYTFTLRDDIFWSDGQPVRAADFEYAWKRLVDPATASPYGDLLNGVVLNAAAIRQGAATADALGVSAPDDRTFVVTLEAPCPYFLSLCAFPALVPLRRDVVEQGDDWTEPGRIVTNGAYIVTEWVHDGDIRMEQNPRYYDLDRLGPDALNWFLSDSEMAALAGYRSGRLQFTDTFPYEMVEELRASGDLFAYPTAGIYFLYLNCQAVTDWRVRAALALAVDRENIVESIVQEDPGQIADGLVFHGLQDASGALFGANRPAPLYGWLAEAYPDADLDSYAGRCELAERLYSEAVADGAWDPDTTIVYLFNNGDAHKAIAEACAADWQSVLGVDTALENQEWGAYTANLAEHRFTVARMGWMADYADALSCLELMTTGNSQNYSAFSSPDYDALIAEGRAAPSSPERDDVLLDAQALLFARGGFPVIPLYDYSSVYCHCPGLRGLGCSPFGYYFFHYATMD